MKKTISLIGMAAVAAFAMACSDDGGGATPISGDGDGTGGATTGTGGATTGTGGATTGTGGGGTSLGDDSTFATNGLGVNGDWNGFLFTVPDDVGGTITPADFATSGASLCVSGTTGPSYEGFGIVGWNIDQPVDDTGAAISDEGNLVTPGGSGVDVLVKNNIAGVTLRVQIQDNSENRWCAAVPAAGGVIPWGDFRKECWVATGDVYAMEPISQVQVQAVAGADPTDPSGATGGATDFDFCVITLGQAP